MRYGFAGWMAALITVLGFPTIICAQTNGRPTNTASNGSTNATSFAPHDLSGVWERDTKIKGPTNPEFPVFAIDPHYRPPMTPWAQERLNANVPEVGSRATPGKQNNPSLRCAPGGVAYHLAFGGLLEIVQIPGRLLMFFEGHHDYRTVWTDGRELPKNPPYPTWDGFSVGKWEGDTFVVDSVGFNDKSWLDLYGDPHSDAMHLQERYLRLDHDRLELTVIIDDPKAYTKTWVNGPKLFWLKPGLELGESYCDPDDEQDFRSNIMSLEGAQSKK